MSRLMSAYACQAAVRKFVAPTPERERIDIAALTSPTRPITPPRLPGVPSLNRGNPFKLNA